MRWLALPLLLLTAPLAAQRGNSHLHGSIGLSAGRFGFEEDDSILDDRTAAGLFQVEFEGTGKRGLGGGLRFEAMASDDDLFAANATTPSEARNGSLFFHFTYRQSAHRFALPIRVGLMFNGLTLEDVPTDIETTYVSLGPYFEIEPELTLVHRRNFRWKIYGQFGAGAGVTAIDIDGDYRDYDSTTGFAGVEVGTRFQVGPAELSIAYIARFQSMDDSDVEDGQYVLGYDSRFRGLLISAGVTF